MNFFDIGIAELLLIFLVILIVFGPGKIPEMARTLGKAIRKLRMASTELSRSLTTEITEEPQSLAKTADPAPNNTQQTPPKPKRKRARSRTKPEPKPAPQPEEEL